MSPVPVTGLISLWAGTVIATDVNHQGVVQGAEFIDRFQQASCLVIGIFRERREYLCLPGIHFSLIVRQVVPVGYAGRLLGKLCALGNNAPSDLVLEGLRTNGIPALVKLAFVFFYPLRGDLVGRV